MRCADTYSHRHGLEEAQRLGVASQLQRVFNAPHVPISKSSTKHIRNHVAKELTLAGWSGKAEVRVGFKLAVTSLTTNAAFQIQTGNISRAMYDLLKLQAMYLDGRIQVAVIAVPVKSAAQIFGSNYAYLERLRSELRLFEHIITVPLLLIGFE